MSRDGPPDRRGDDERAPRRVVLLPVRVPSAAPRLGGFAHQAVDAVEGVEDDLVVRAPEERDEAGDESDGGELPPGYLQVLQVGFLEHIRG